MSPKTVSPTSRGTEKVRPKRATKRAAPTATPPTKRERRIAGQKDYVIILAPTKSRDRWVATVEKNGEPMEGVRVEASTYRATLDGAFKALEQRVRRGLIDNVAWQLKFSARKRRVIERVQPASNAAYGAHVEAIVAYREFLHWSRRTVEVLREEGLSEEDLAQIALCDLRTVREWLSSDREADPRWTEIPTAYWLSGCAVNVIQHAEANRKAVAELDALARRVGGRARTR